MQNLDEQISLDHLLYFCIKSAAIMTTMKVAQLVEPGKPLTTSTIEKPIPGPKDVLVKVEAACLVPNSANIVKKGPGLHYTLPKMPCVFGLDAAGIIEAVGKNVVGLKVGDRVYVDPHITCGNCKQCRKGRRELCTSGCLRAYFGTLTPGGQKILKQYPIGSLSQYLLSPDANIAVIPPSIDINTAARFGYIGTSFAGLKKCGMGPGKTLLINGVTGTLGYAAVAIGLGLGCTKILGIGRNKERLAEVEGMATKGRVVVRSTEDDGDILEWIKEQTNGFGTDGLYDCLGNGGDANGTSKLISSVKRGGRVALAAGGVPGDITHSYGEVMTHDVSVNGTLWFTSEEIDEAIELIGAGVIDFSFLQHKFFSLDEVNDAFKTVGDRPGGAINIIVQPHA
ncbi:eef7c0de-ab6f-410b-93a0-f6bad3c09e12 [Sclerotinia trifoliorum]|uniref:Eef7c0de-ab6f-410b-93a0-f6bad3c09e12 n=1 Tax=Sclerotinia trifoliorum TaxID=28548 RepID=A0A8H2VNR1_9HELO|nr:eef7c0de-ab6f-410b-93a0-f6bad3c09e12 [Sclerotinia trifoliorum]